MKSRRAGCANIPAMKNDTRHNVRLIGWSLIWAVGMILAAIYYKGNPARDQVEAAITVAGTFVLLALLPRETTGSCLRFRRR